jgi:hypothetical protein
MVPDVQFDRAWKEGCAVLQRLERVIGIEPTFTAWEAVVLPLDDTRERGGL